MGFIIVTACSSSWFLGPRWILLKVLASAGGRCLCGLLRAQFYHSLSDTGVLPMKRDARSP